jgi:hypothetical protein
MDAFSFSFLFLACKPRSFYSVLQISGFFSLSNIIAYWFQISVLCLHVAWVIDVYINVMLKLIEVEEIAVAALLTNNRFFATWNRVL